MTGQLTLRVITPDRIVVDETVESVRVPALDGSMGILPRHATMVAGLDTGLLEYRIGGGGESVVFVSGGFAEVRSGTVRIVTQAGERSDDIDEDRALAAQERARRRIEEGRAGPIAGFDLVRAQAALRRALVRQRARVRR